MINATKVFIYTLLILLALYYLSKVLYNLQVNQTDKSINVLLMFLILVSIVTIVGVGLSYNILPHTKDIMPSRGNKGKRGFRGKSGKAKKCGLKCMDNACYYKIMTHITNVYNLWLKLHRRPLLAQGEFINNQYLKKKVKEMCDSQIFNNLIERQGAHKLTKTENPFNSNKCDIYKNCGAYDYIFQMWTEWILTILKYDKGHDFIESDYMNDNDFDNMITDNDLIITSDWIFDPEDSIINIIDQETLNITDSEKEQRLEHFYNSDFAKFYLADGVPDASLYNINRSSSLEEKSLAKTKLKSPFEIIQEYDSWYWGANPLSIPQFVNKCEFETENFDFKNRIKVKLTNDYEEIWDSTEARQSKGVWVHSEKNYDSTYKPYLPLGNKDVKIFRAKDFYDNGEKNLDFRSYKPVGDVLVTIEESERGKSDTTEHFPRYLNKSYNSAPVKSNTSGPRRLTILVSGDTKHPTGFQRKYIRKRTEGFQANNLTFSVWRPIPPRGYVSLGDVITNDVNGLPPDTSIVVCVPRTAVKTYTGEKENVYNTDTPTSRITETTGYTVSKSDTDSDSHVSFIRMNKPNDPPLKITGKLNENYAGDPYRQKESDGTESLDSFIDKNLLAFNTFRVGGNTTFDSIRIENLYDDDSEINTKEDYVNEREKYGRKYSILKLYE
jgi:hypothetical protein